MSEPAEAAPASKGGGKKKLIIMIAAVLLLGGGGAGAWFSGFLPRLLGKGEPAVEAAAHGASPAKPASHGAAPGAHGAAPAAGGMERSRRGRRPVARRSWICRTSLRTSIPARGVRPL